LQALVLLNDETYLEAARSLAVLVLKTNADDEARLRDAFQRAVSRPPNAREIEVLKTLLDQQRKRFQSDPEAARKVAAGEERSTTELAAWTLSLHTLFNLDETITRR